MPSKKKKEPSTEKAKKIIELRDTLIAKGMDAEKVGLACKGMYRCDKLTDDKCLDEIMAKLNKIKKDGGSSKSKPRSRSRSKSKTNRK